ncbi:MAG: 3'-5' exonuclease [Candidatus Izemoplasmatales bacterium]
MHKKNKKLKKSVLVIDLEACCWRGNPPIGQHKEIIEIGVACVDYFTKEIIRSKSIIVKPQFSEISSFCTELTTLTSEYVNENGVSLSDACQILIDEFGSDKKMWFSWGDYDKLALQSECKLKKITYPMSKTHVNLKELFAFFYGTKQPPSVSSALKKMSIDFNGTRHRGIDDAKMTAIILKNLVEKK